MTTRRTVATAVGAAALLGTAPTAAHADTPSPKLAKQYDAAYQKAAKRDHDVGRNIVRDDVLRKRGPGRRPATEREVRRSLSVLQRMTAAAPAGATASGSTASPALEAIAACESGGDPTAVSADGTYRGKYQFDYGTWAAVGGSGDPAAAPEAEQDARAAQLYAQRGASPWPVCG